MIGADRHRVTVQQQTPGPVSDGDGAYDETWIDATPAAWDVSVTPATARDLEQAAAGTVTSKATHLVSGRYRPDISTLSRVLFNGRPLNVVGVTNVQERGIRLELVCVEVVT